jgi:hypothetical protein
VNSLVLFKLALVLLLVFIIFNLARALVIMVKGNQAQPMSHYLGRRVLFSVLVVALLLLALGFGLVEPNPRPY